MSAVQTPSAEASPPADSEPANTVFAIADRNPSAGSAGNREAPGWTRTLVAILAEVRTLRQLTADGRGTSRRDAERVALGPHAVLSVRRAAERLPMADADARRWLQEQGLVRTLCTEGRTKEVVVWGAVLERLQEAPVAGEERAPAPRARRRRSRPSTGLRRAQLG